jgi:hypothetical protein
MHMAPSMKILLSIIALSAAIAGQAPPPTHAPKVDRPATTQPQRTTMDLRINPLMDLHCGLRAQASKGDEADRAIQTLKEIDRELGGGLAWGLLEAPLSSCNSAREAKELMAQLPESFQMRDGKSLPLREMAVKLADALTEAEPKFLAERWTENKKQLEVARDRIATEFLPKQAECYADVLEHLGMTDPGRTIAVYLVTQAPFPGAVTHRSREGGGVCFVSLESAKSTQLYETILHESIHALDIATESQDPPTVLQTLRNKLREAGIAPTDRIFRDVPHTLMFVQAGETIRRIVDPAHKHYGDVHGYYPKVPRATEAVRPAWEACLRGEITRDAAVKRIVELVLQSKAPSG